MSLFENFKRIKEVLGEENKYPVKCDGSMFYGEIAQYLDFDENADLIADENMPERFQEQYERLKEYYKNNK